MTFRQWIDFILLIVFWAILMLTVFLETVALTRVLISFLSMSCIIIIISDFCDEEDVRE